MGAPTKRELDERLDTAIYHATSVLSFLTEAKQHNRTRRGRQRVINVADEVDSVCSHQGQLRVAVKHLHEYLHKDS